MKPMSKRELERSRTSVRSGTSCQLFELGRPTLVWLFSSLVWPGKYPASVLLWANLLQTSRELYTGKEVISMRYEAPQMTLLGKAIDEIQNSVCPKGIFHTDSTSECQTRSTPPAYEADE